MIKMTNYVFFLLSYIKFGVAVTLDTNQVSILERSRIGENSAILASTDFKSLNPIIGDVNNWFMFEKHKGSDDILLLDNILSVLLDHFYKKKDVSHLERSVQLTSNLGTANLHLLHFLHHVNNNKLTNIEEKKTKSQLVKTNLYGPIMIFRRIKPYNSVAMNIEVFTPKHTLVKPRFHWRTSNKNLEMLNIRNYEMTPNIYYNSQMALKKIKRKLFSKRSRFPTNTREEMKESKQQKLSTAPITADSNMVSQFILRSARGNRQYDVPQIECPLSDDGMERFACPTADRMGRYRCIDDHVLCDGFIDCPMGEDEARQACMFYKTTKAHLDVLADALLRWARGR